MINYNMNNNNVSEESEINMDINKINYVTQNVDNEYVKDICNDENNISYGKSSDIPMNNAIFTLMLYPEMANLFCSYGDISTYVHEKEDMFFMDENEVIFMHIPYKKGLHLLKCLGYEKASVSIMPFDVSVTDEEESPNAIYYDETWRKIQ